MGLFTTRKYGYYNEKTIYSPRSEGGADELEHSGRLFGAESSKSTLDSALVSGIKS